MDLLVLDYHICTCVLLPIFALVLLSTVLRQKLMAPQARVELNRDPEQQFVSSVMSKSSLLRTSGLWILPARSFFCRQEELIHRNGQTQGLLWNAPQSSASKSLEKFAKQDPTAAFSAIKSQLAFVVLQGGMAYLTNSLFSGFVVAKTPFSLPYKFKAMLQRGVEVPLLDVTYVSSLSWYFLVMLSIGGFFVLLNAILDPSPGDGDQQQAISDIGAAQLQAAIGLPPGGALMPGMGAPDPGKLFEQEREALQIVQPMEIMEKIPELLLRQWGIEA